MCYNQKRRKIFFKDLDQFKPNDRQLKASAWYVACYSSAENKRFKILSFPWIIEDVLQSFSNIENYDLFSKSIIETFAN